MTKLQKMILIYIAALIAMVAVAVHNSSAHAHPDHEQHTHENGR